MLLLLLLRQRLGWPEILLGPYPGRKGWDGLRYVPRILFNEPAFVEGFGESSRTYTGLSAWELLAGEGVLFALIALLYLAGTQKLHE